MWHYELHPLHLISVGTLPRETQNTENVILQQEHCIKLHQGAFIQQCVYEIKIHGVEDMWKRLMQTWFDLDQDIIIDTAKDQ